MADYLTTSNNKDYYMNISKDPVLNRITRLMHIDLRVIRELFIQNRRKGRLVSIICRKTIKPS